MADNKELPSTELSLKYIAWNVKEIAESIKKLTQALEEFCYYNVKSSEKAKHLGQNEAPF